MFHKYLIASAALIWVLSLQAESYEVPRRLGCYEDKIIRDMSVEFHMPRMTARSCVDLCKSKGYWYAGLQDGEWCNCGNTFGSAAVWRESDGRCQTKCKGDPTVTCGGKWANEVHATGLKDFGRINIGCYKDPDLTDMQISFPYMEDTLQRYIFEAAKPAWGRKFLARNTPSGVSLRTVCLNICNSRGFRYAGLQYKRQQIEYKGGTTLQNSQDVTQCSCGNTYGRFGKMPKSACWKPCPGEEPTSSFFERCGGQNMMDVFATGVTQFAARRIGCFRDATPKEFPVQFHAANMTREFCLKVCRTYGHKYVALQSQAWCGCGNKYGRYGPVSDSQCSLTCFGDSTVTCGGWGANEVFDTGLNATMKPTRVGCFKDQNPRDMQDSIMDRIMTRYACFNYCKSRGYAYFALQAKAWCYCDNFFGRYGRLSDAHCQEPCFGDADETCGGWWANEVFVTGLPVKACQGSC